MRIEVAALAPPVAGPPALTGAGLAAAFAELLGEGAAAGGPGEPAQVGADPAEAAAAQTLLMRPSGEHRDQERSLRAFAFGVFGLFPPDLDHGVAGEPETSPALAPASGVPAGADGTGAAQPTVAISGATGLRAGEPPMTPFAAGGLGERTPLAASIDGGAVDVRLANAAAPAAFRVSDEAPAVQRPAAARTPRQPMSRRPDPANLVVLDQDGRLAVFAAVAGLDAADHGALRARLRDAAARLGLTLEEIQLNGLIGPEPVTGGDRHGRGAR
jgi:hypothetical protein